MNDKYAFLMIDYETPNLIKDIQNEIKDDDIYNNDNNEYGIENESHVTLFPCMENDTDVNELKKLLYPLEKYKIILTNIGIFENELYDVLKADVFSPFLYRTNYKIKEKYVSHSEFKDYKPHMTIAYLKSGTGKKYIRKNLDAIIEANPKCFNFSFYKNNKQNNLYF